MAPVAMLLLATTALDARAGTTEYLPVAFDETGDSALVSLILSEGTESTSFSWVVPHDTGLLLGDPDAGVILPALRLLEWEQGFRTRDLSFEIGPSFSGNLRLESAFRVGFATDALEPYPVDDSFGYGTPAVEFAGALFLLGEEADLLGSGAGSSGGVSVQSTDPSDDVRLFKFGPRDVSMGSALQNGAIAGLDFEVRVSHSRRGSTWALVPEPSTAGLLLLGLLGLGLRSRGLRFTSW